MPRIKRMMSIMKPKWKWHYICYLSHFQIDVLSLVFSFTANCGATQELEKWCAVENLLWRFEGIRSGHDIHVHFFGPCCLNRLKYIYGWIKFEANERRVRDMQHRLSAGIPSWKCLLAFMQLRLIFTFLRNSLDVFDITSKLMYDIMNNLSFLFPRCHVDLAPVAAEILQVISGSWKHVMVKTIKNHPTFQHLRTLKMYAWLEFYF